MRTPLIVLAACTTLVAFAADQATEMKKDDTPISKRPTIHRGPFGSCCDDLKECMSQPNALIRVSEQKSLFLAIGYVQTDKGVGWFDQAIIYCPFCGKQLQDRDELQRKAAAGK